MNATEVFPHLADGGALPLWAVLTVRNGMTQTFGTRLRGAIANCTRNRLGAFLTGLTLTSVLQCSTATALIVASFPSRHLMATVPPLAAVLGADVGSTLLAQALTY